MIRLAPIDFGNLPNHQDFEATTAKRPNLLPFVLTILDQGRNLLLPTQFNLAFKHHSQKSSPPSNNEVEVLSTSVPESDLESLPWDGDTLPRPKPSKFDDEHWYARRSYHHNLSVKRNSPGTASWDEFVYGLRDNHSENEANFTPSIYDTRLATDWTDELNHLLSTHAHSDSSSPKYSHATMTLREMCHKLPSPTGPRCFPVLVITASVSESEFLAVTLPVDMRNYPGAFYSNKRNRKEGTDSQSQKPVTLGMYVAVERVQKYPKQANPATRAGSVQIQAGEAEAAPAPAVKHPRGHAEGEVDEEIEWIMATASHTRGNIPVVMQRMGVPGAIVKDVGLFLKWIGKVPAEDVRRQVHGESATGSVAVPTGETSNVASA